MQEYKIIHFNLFRPERSLFKMSRNEKAEVQIISCCNSNNCGLYERGECCARTGLCPYGKNNRYIGFTKRASKYRTWCNKQEDKYKGIKFLKIPVKVIASVGGYIFLPYIHMTMCGDVTWHGQLLKKEDFTVENIIKFIHFRPYAVFGGEIKSYQKEVPSRFLKHLSEQMPDLFKQAIATDEYSRQRFKEYSNIGRKAILETIIPNIGEFKDIHGGLWRWDGETLKSTNSHASFMLIKDFKELILIPEKGQSVIITDEKQINKNTIFQGE